MKLHRFAKIIIVFVIIIPTLLWLVAGPGTRWYLKQNEQNFIAQISDATDGLVKVGGIGGDFLTGFTASTVVVYPDREVDHFPLISADEIHFRYSMLVIFTRDSMPGEVLIDGFEGNIHIDERGKVAVPDFSIARGESPRVLHAGWFAGSGAVSRVPVYFRDGTIEVHKKFPDVQRTVNTAFFKVKGDGIFIEDTAFVVNSFSSEYQGAPMEAEAYIPFDDNEDLDISASLTLLNFSSLFRDFEPLFGSSQYFPSGTISIEKLSIKGRDDNFTVTGDIKVNETRLGNVKVDTAEGNVTWSEGVIELGNFTAQAYGGSLTGSGRINMLSETPIWSSACSFENVDIPGYLDQNGYLKYEVTGGFSGTLDASGDFNNPDSLKADLSIVSSGGRFLTPFSDRFMNVTQGVVDESPVSDADLADYSEIEVDAGISDSVIRVTRLHFVSEDLQAEASGSVGFEKTISASGGLSIPTSLAKQHPKFGSYISFLPDSLERVSLEFSVSGTLSQPKFSANPTANFLKGLIDHTSDLLHDIGDSVTGDGN